MAIDFKKALKGAQKNWSNAKKRAAEDTGGFQELEDGICTARLVSAKIDQSGSGRLQVVIGWKIEDGPNDGKTKNAYNGLESEDNLFYLGRDLGRLGYDMPDDITDLPEVLKALEKERPLAQIALKTKGDFQNVYIRKVYASDVADEESEDEEADEIEDVDEVEAESDEDVEDTDADEDAEESDDDEAESDDDDAEESDDEESDDADADEDEDEDEDAEDEDDAGDDDDEEGVELEVGMAVMAETAKGKEKGKVIEIDEAAGKVRVELKSGRIVKIGVDKLEISEAPPSRKAEKAPAKKAAPAPAKKPASKKPAPAPAKKPAGKAKTAKRR